METHLPISLDERKAECKPLVLIVDDDPVHHKLMELISERLEFTAHMVSSCAEAMEALSIFSFDLVLMDYRMPKVDGCKCAHQIREMRAIRHDIAIITVTADVIKGTREKCLEAGMNDFLEKPFTLEQLHEKVNYWLQRKTE